MIGGLVLVVAGATGNTSRVTRLATKTVPGRIARRTSGGTIRAGGSRATVPTKTGPAIPAAKAETKRALGTDETARVRAARAEARKEEAHRLNVRQKRARLELLESEAEQQRGLRESGDRARRNTEIHGPGKGAHVIRGVGR